MFEINMVQAARDNNNFRKTLFTGDHTQLVAMSLLEGEEIGLETHHKNDQLLLIIDGSSKIAVGEDTKDVGANEVVVVPAGTPHNVANQGHSKLKLITVYAPPDHAPGTVHETKADALKDEGPPEQ